MLAEALSQVLPLFEGKETTEARVQAVREALGASGPELRPLLGEWIATLLSVETLVPDAFDRWRPLVHESMSYVASHISDERLAPKIVEQVELPEDTSIESRLIRVIAKTPGLQKLGQVLARTRNLTPALRRELQSLENGISDMTAEEISGIIYQQLGPSLRAYQVELARVLLSEASVSAVIEFTWRNPEKGLRESGVFKVVKPHVPLCYAEDLALLQGLAQHLAGDEGDFQFASKAVSETLDEVRMLLQHEVDFRREQVTLADVNRMYRRRGFHAPQPIPELCTDTITAMSYERGVKVTDAYAERPALRRRVATQIVEALIAEPMLSDEEETIFHADPHAGNLLYDEVAGELVVLDWALTGRLTRTERRQAARLIAAMTLRDRNGVRDAVVALSRPLPGTEPANLALIESAVKRYFQSLPHVCSLGAIDAMRLLDSLGMEGVRFPATLVLLRKVLFTLDGVLHDVAGGAVRMDTVIAREFSERALRNFGSVPPPFTLSDYLAVQRSAVAYALGFWAI
jgi:ubiquinone biosynthesis protein